MTKDALMIQLEANQAVLRGISPKLGLYKQLEEENKKIIEKLKILREGTVLERGPSNRRG